MSAKGILRKVHEVGSGQPLLNTENLPLNSYPYYINVC